MDRRKIYLTFVLVLILALHSIATLGKNDEIVDWTNEQDAERIIGLPGQPTNVDFAQYSRYITVEKNIDRDLFYCLIATTEDPYSKPLFLWLNGGIYYFEKSNSIYP